MFVANQVKHTVDHQKNDHFHLAKTGPIGLALGRLDRNHQVTEEMGMEGGEFSLPHGESKDIGGFVPTEILTVQRLNLEVIDKKKTELSLKKSQFGQYPLDRLSYLS
jgi:hypothetical protein